MTEQTTRPYPRWLIIWFAVSVVAVVIATIALPIVHHLVIDPWKPFTSATAALAWASLAGSLLKGEEYEDAK